MYEDSRKKLERQLMLQRLKWVGAGALVVLVIAAAMWVQGIDATVTTHKVGGVIERVGPVPGASGAAIGTAVLVDIRLDDGREARVVAKTASEHAVGTHVEIAEHVHGTGRSNFSWK